MSLQDFLPENPNYPQQFKFPDTVNNNVKIKYHYLDATFTVPDPPENQFMVEMNVPGSNLLKSYKNVKSIELISAFFNTTLFPDDPPDGDVIYMHIDELEGVIDSNVLGGQKAFAKLMFNTTDAINTNFRKAIIDYGMNPSLEFETKGKRLDKMTIRFKIPNGNSVTYAAGNQINLTFKIGVVEPIVPA